MRSRLIVNPKKSYSLPIDQFTYYLLVHSIVFMNSGLYLISSVSSTYTMKITVPSSFTLYSRQGSVLNCFNNSFRVVVFMDSLNRQFSSCTRPYIEFISVNISLYVYYSSITSSIPYGVIMYIYFSSNAHKNAV